MSAIILIIILTASVNKSNRKLKLSMLLYEILIYMLVISVNSKLERVFGFARHGARLPKQEFSQIGSNYYKE